MYTESEFTRTVDADGAELVSFEVDSNTLPYVEVDTYGMHNGDNWTENTLENFGSGESDAPYDSPNYDDYEWDYDHAGIIKGLAETSIREILDQLAGDGVIKSIEFISTYSPREYNFTSDSFKARWTINLAKLTKWCDDAGFDPDEYAREFHSSYSGFISFVDGWLSDPDRRPGTVLWLRLCAYLRAELDEESLKMALWEDEDSIYDENVTITRKDQED